jgi:hypothetical protein
MTKIKWFVLVFLLFAGLGYLREFFFVNLNVILFEKYYHSVSPVPVPSVMDIFRQFSYASLYYSKYLYTLIWVLIFFGASLLSLKKLTRTPFLIRLLVYIYGLLLLLAALSMLYGYFVNGRLQEDEYTISRWLMGIAQSPIICLILVASEKLYLKSFQS